MKYTSSRSIASASLLVGALLSIVGFSSPARADKAFFASDIHEFGTSKLKPILQREVQNGSYDLLGLVGDYQSGVTADVSSYNSILQIANDYRGTASVVLSQGNHDARCSSQDCFTHATGQVFDVGQDITVYPINPKELCSPNRDVWYPALHALDEYLLSHYGRVVFVLSHYPFHTTRLSNMDGLGTNCVEQAQNLFSILQVESGIVGRDIVYVWGHNHSSSSYDDGVDYTVTRGEAYPDASNILESVRNVPIYFTSINAGYMKGSTSISPIFSKVETTATEITVKRYRYSASQNTITEQGNGLTVTRLRSRD